MWDEDNRDEQLAEAIELLEELLPFQFMGSYILITVHGWSRERRAEDIGVEPSVIDEHIAAVEALIEKHFR